MNAPDSRLQRSAPPRRLWLAAVALSVAYLVAARMGFVLTLRPIPVSTLWMPNAILLAAFVLTPPKTWWLLLAAVLPAHLFVELSVGVPITMAACWFVSNSVEAALGAYLLRREGPVSLETSRNVWRFVLYAGLLAPGLSSFLDAGLVMLNDWGGGTYWRVWEIRFRSNVLAMLTVAPVVITWGTTGVKALREATPRRITEAVVLVLCLLGVSYAAFSTAGGGMTRAPALLYAPLPFLLWSAIRFGPVGSSTSLLLVVLLAVSGAALGHGPFTLYSSDQNALAMQVLFGGIAVGLMSLTAVVEERRRALEVAQLREDQLQLALEGARMGVWLYRTDSRTLELSGVACQVLGLEGDTSLSLHDFLRLIHPDDHRLVTEAFRNAIVDGDPFELEFRLERPGERNGWIVAKGKLLGGEKNERARLVGLFGDITPRKLWEALSASHSRIIGMIAKGASLGPILDEALRCVEAEAPPMVCSVLLLDPDGIHARHASAPSLPEEYVRAIDGFAIGPDVGSCGAAMYLKRPVFSFDILRDPRWGRYRQVAVHHGFRACWSSPLLAEDGTVLGSFAGYYRKPRKPGPADIRLMELTARFLGVVIERSRQEAEAHEKQRALAHLGRVVMLGELTGTLAHELNQPLTVILSQAEAGLRMLERQPTQLDFIGDTLRDIVEADRRASQVIRRLRSMLRKEETPLRPVDLCEVVASTLELSQKNLRSQGIEVEVRLASDLPPVLGDRIQLQQVVLNLVLNASDAMKDRPGGSRQLVVEMVVADGGELAHITISDSGPGIPSELMERIFEPFFTEKDDGLGLGLGICRSIVSKHHGRLWVENNVDQGATFHIVLPTLVEADAPVRESRMTTHLMS